MAAVPLFPPLHVTLVVLSTVIVIGTGSCIANTDTAVHNLLSVTTTVYVPEDKLDAEAVFPPCDQLYVYPGVPPVTNAVAEPPVEPGHNGFVVLIDTDNNVG